MSTIIVGDIAEGQQWWGQVEFLKQQLANNHARNNAFMQTWKQLSADVKVFIKMVAGKPQAFIYVSGGVYVTVMDTVSADALSVFPNPYLPPFQDLRLRSLYLQSAESTGISDHYAGGLPNISASPRVTSFYIGNPGGSWHDAEFTRAISWTTTWEDLSTTLFIKGRFGAIPFQSLMTSNPLSSIGIDNCYISSAMLTADGIVVTLWQAQQASEADSYHIKKYSVAINEASGELDFTELSSIRLLTNVGPGTGDIPSHASFTGFTYDGLSVASWRRGSLCVISSEDGFYSVDISPLEYNPGATAVFSLVVAEKSTFSCVYNRRVNGGPIYLVDLMSYSANTGFTVVSEGIAAFSIFGQRVSFGYLSLDNGIYYARKFGTEYNNTIASALHTPLIDMESLAGSDFYDYGFTSEYGVLDFPGLQQHQTGLNASANKFITVLSFSNATNTYGGAYVIDNASYSVTFLESIDMYNGARYPIGLTYTGG